MVILRKYKETKYKFFVHAKGFFREVHQLSDKFLHKSGFKSAQ